jgi:hypothetical protein
MTRLAFTLYRADRICIHFFGLNATEVAVMMVVAVCMGEMIAVQL